MPELGEDGVSHQTPNTGNTKQEQIKAVQSWYRHASSSLHYHVVATVVFNELRFPNRLEPEECQGRIDADAVVDKLPPSV